MSDRESNWINALRCGAGIGLMAMMVYLPREFPWYLYGLCGLLIWGVKPPQTFESWVDFAERLIRAWRSLPQKKDDNK